MNTKQTQKKKPVVGFGENGGSAMGTHSSKKGMCKRRPSPKCYLAILVLLNLLFGLGAEAQSCSAPILDFKNPTLISGTASQVGVTYRFNNVLTNVNAVVTLTAKSHPDIEIFSIDAPQTTYGGYNSAFQPIIDYNWINGNGTFDHAGEKNVTFKIDFVSASTGVPVPVNLLHATALDIDGSTDEVREFVVCSGFQSYEIQSPTTLTLSGALKAKGGLPTFPAIDETALTAMISFVFENKSSISITFGGDYNGSTIGFGDTDPFNTDEKRLNSLFMKCYNFNTSVDCQTVSATGGGSFCAGASTILTATTTGGSGTCTLQWQRSTDNITWADVVGATSNTYNIPSLASTAYFRAAYSCTGNITCGTAYSDVLTLSVFSTPTANAGADKTMCLGFGTPLTASASGAQSPYTYTWSHGLGTGTSKTVNPPTTTTYTVTVTSANGCNNTDQVTVTVQPCPEICGNGLDDDGDGLADCADFDCGPQADLGGGISVCAGNSAFLSVSVTGGNGALSYAWSHGLGGGQVKAVSPISTTTYTVTVTAPSGCTDMAQVTVTVNVCGENCTNGVDDDNDGLVDCADPDCAGVTAPVLADDFYSTCPGMPYSERISYNDGNLQSPSYSIFSNPLNGTVSIDGTGRFQYVPASASCNVDFFMYQVCNQVSGCCDQATVTLNFQDIVAPVLTNVPADLTISCDDAVPPAGVVTAFDQCPGVYVDFNENSSQHYVGACGTYTITRTWDATDLCGNSSRGVQQINVMDPVKPEIFQVYTLANGAKFVAGVSQRVTHDWKGVRFPISFAQPPVVLTQLISNTDPGAALVQQRNVYTQGFELRLREEEMADNRHVGEQVAWLAIEPSAQNGDFSFQANTLSNVTEALRTLNFTQSFNQPPLFFSTLQTTNQADPAVIRHTAIGTHSVSLFLQEETSRDVEIAHISETLGFLAIGQSSVLTDKTGEVFGEMGTASLTNAWATIALTRKYTKPVVLMGGLSNNDNSPVSVRIRNLTSTTFQVRLQEWDYLDGNHLPESVSWMVVEGAIPGNGGYYCSGKADNLIPGINIFAVDNCDNLVAFATDEISENLGTGILTTRTWTALDDCGNLSLVTRYDTCTVAAVKVEALLHGAYFNNGNTSLMRDDLRTSGLVPVREPYSKLTGFEHVEDQSANYATICHNPGTIGQETLIIPNEMLQDHLNLGDVVGACQVPTTVEIPFAANAATYKTIAAGNWNDPATWLGGSIPPANMNNVAISVQHDVVFPTGNVTIQGSSAIWVTNASLTFPYGSVILNHNTKFRLANASLSIQNGNFELWTGSGIVLDIKNSDLYVSGHFNNWDGLRRLENVCLTIGGNFQHDNFGADSLFHVTATIGGDFLNTKNAKTHLSHCNIRLTNGKVENELLATLSGNNIVLWVENGNVINLGLWTAPISQYCIFGSIFNLLGIFPALENCIGISSYFGQSNCTLSATTVELEEPNPNSISPAEITGPGTIDPLILETTGNQAVVDWVLVELRDPSDRAKVLGYATSIVLRDGRILSENGDETIVFEHLPEGDYYVAVRHRNHLGMVTDAPFFLSTVNTPDIDFTDPSLPVNGGASAGRNNSGKRTFWSGDYNGDGKVIYQGPNNDVFYLFSRVVGDENNTDNLANFIVVSYERPDFNLDGRVIYQGPNNDRASLLYHTVLAHGGNTGLLANFIAKAFLP